MHNFRARVAATSAAQEAEHRYLYKRSRSAPVFALAIVAAACVYLLTWLAYTAIVNLTLHGLISRAPDLNTFINHVEVTAVFLFQHHG